MSISSEPRVWIKLQGLYSKIWRVDCPEEQEPLFAGKIEFWGVNRYLKFRSTPQDALDDYNLEIEDMVKARAAAGGAPACNHVHAHKQQRAVGHQGANCLTPQGLQAMQQELAYLPVQQLHDEVEAVLRSFNLHRMTFFQLRAKLEGDLQVSLRGRMTKKYITGLIKDWLVTHPYPAPPCHTSYVAPAAPPSVQPLVVSQGPAQAGTGSAAANTWQRPPAQDNLLDIVPLGTVRGNFSIVLDGKRVFVDAFGNMVADDANMKQDTSIDVDSRPVKKVRYEAMAAAAAEEEEDEEEAEAAAQAKMEAAADELYALLEGEAKQEPEADELDAMLTG